jgi:hypothetical protein
MRISDIDEDKSWYSVNWISNGVFDKTRKEDEHILVYYSF